MKLFLLRHAKSSWEHSDLSDFDRPLNDRGLSAAPFMGRLMRERGFSPDLILSSPARRARDTASLVREAAAFPAEMRLDERIYEASPSTLLQVLKGIDDNFDNVMLVGHNPGMEALIRSLSGSTEAMPTAALACIELDISTWKEAAPNSGRLTEVIRPKQVNAAD
jgi:phosphohistidine phosphatase